VGYLHRSDLKFETSKLLDWVPRELSNDSFVDRL
jgi:hypothetical protein